MKTRTRAAPAASSNQRAHRAVLRARACVEQGRADRAIRLLAAAWRTPAVRRPQIATLLSRLQVQAGNSARALLVLREAASIWPGDAGIRHAAAQRMLAEDQVAEATDLLQQVAASGGADSKTLSLLARCHTKAGKWLDVLRVLEPLREHENIDDITRHHFVVAALRANQPGRLHNHPWLSTAWQDADRQLVCGLTAALFNPATPASVERKRGTLSEAAQEDCRHYTSALMHNNLTTHVRRLVDAVAGHGATLGTAGLLALYLDGAEQEAHDQLLELHRGNLIDVQTIPQLLRSVLNSTTTPEVRAVSEELISRIPDAGTRATSTLLLAQHLLALGDEAGARALLARISPPMLAALTAHHRLWIKTLLASGEPVTAPAGLQPDEVIDGCIRVYRHGEHACVIWFAGIDPAAHRGLEARCLPMWKALGISVLLVNDNSRLAGLRGFGSHAPDFSASAEALSGLVQREGFSEVFTTGTSLAGYTAALYGCALNALGVLSFAGPTHIPQVSEMPDSRGVLSLRRLLRATGDTELPDLARLLKNRPTPVVHQHFGKDSVFDAWQASRMTSVASVHLFPGEHDKHAVVPWLQEQGKLEPAIRQFVADARRAANRTHARIQA